MSNKTGLILGVLILVALGAALFLRSKQERPVSPEGSSSLIVGNNAIYVTEQSPGHSVLVSVVRLEKPGFVVIHEDSEGQAGRVLGASQLLPGGEIKNPPPIALSQETSDGQTLYAALHLDNGNGVFDAVEDKPALDPVGKAPVATIVSVSKEAVTPGVVNP